MILYPSSLTNIAEKINDNQVGLFPSDTVWGLFGAVNNITLEKLIRLKQRPPESAFIIIIPDISFLDQIANTTSEQKTIAKTYWPGPTTLVLPKSEKLSDTLTAGKQTVAVRMPYFPPLNCLLMKCKTPLFSTSANLSSHPLPKRYNDISPEITKNIDWSFTSIEPPKTSPSVILDLTVTPYKRLR